MWIRLAIFLLFAIPISVIDFKQGRIPDALSLPAAAAMALQLALWDHEAFVTGATGAALCFGLLWIVRLVTKGLGMGDVKFGLAIGFAGGPLPAFAALLLASASALAIALPLLALGKIDRKTKLPFGPFLSLGTTLALILVELVIFQI